MTDSAAGRRPLLVAAGLVWWGSQLLVQRRPAHKEHGARRLEFPGGKLEAGESPRQALARELVEEWGAHASSVRIGAAAEILHHVYPPPGPEVLLMVFHVNTPAWTEDPRPSLRLEPGATVELFAPAQLPTEEFLAADQAFVEDLRRSASGPPASS